MDPQSLFIWATAAVSFVLILYLLLGGGTATVNERVASLRAQESPPAQVGGNLSTRDIKNHAERATAKRLQEENRRERMRNRIVQAGLYKRTAMVGFTTMRLFLFAIPIAGGFMAAEAGAMTRTQGIILGALVGVMGTLAPSFWLDYRKAIRQKKIRRALPDALDVMVVCLEGGLSLAGSMSRVARELGEAHPMLAMELGIVEREIQMGMSTGDALKRFAQRFDVEELRSLAAVTSQAERFGSSVIRALTVYADTMRLKRQQRAEELAQKATVKILFPTLLCIFPGIFIVILGPAAIQIYYVLLQGAFGAG